MTRDASYLSISVGMASNLMMGSCAAVVPARNVAMLTEDVRFPFFSCALGCSTGKAGSSRSRNRSANTLPLVYSCSHEGKRRPSSLHDLIPTHIIQVPKKLEGVLSAASEISSRAVSSARDQLIRHASFQSQQQKSETINTKEKTRTKMRKL